MPPPAALSASSSLILLSPPPSPKPKLPPFSPRKRSVAITPRRHPLHSAPSSAVRCAVIEKETPETHRPDTFLRENSSSSVRARFEKMIRDAQDTVCAAIEAADGGATFKDDVWSRPGGGGGISRVLQDGAVWEKAGVNVSVVYGVMPPEAYRAAKDAAAADHKPGPVPFFAAGVSSVLHSKNPFAPTLHFNYRYFETDAPQDAPGAPRQWWFWGWFRKVLATNLILPSILGSRNGVMIISISRCWFADLIDPMGRRGLILDGRLMNDEHFFKGRRALDFEADFDEERRELS